MDLNLVIIARLESLQHSFLIFQHRPQLVLYSPVTEVARGRTTR